jgi:DNA (cytosine-5)-methyltransferase 1
MRLLDLFCGAGGAAEGYRRAGFEVVGVDINPQPHYPFEFIQGDALRMLELCGGMQLDKGFDAIHASPPCQAFTAYQRTGVPSIDHPDLIEIVRWLLRNTGVPWVIENVTGAPLQNPIQLCGTGFGLKVQRHRLFETNFPLMSPGCSHGR